MRVIVVGPPGAGKGEQCQRLAARLGAPHVSTGDLFRAAAIGETPTAVRLREIMAAGELVPDRVAIDVLRRRIALPDCKAGFVVDGFPRTGAQARALGIAMVEDNVHLDGVVLLDVSDAVALERMTGRRLDPVTGRSWHLTLRPPPPDVRARLVQRDDDSDDAAHRQLATWLRESPAVLSLYEDRGMLLRVAGDGAPEAVHQRIVEALRP